MKLDLYSRALTIFVVLMSVFHSYTAKAQDADHSTPDLYIASGLSISNTEDLTFGERSYPSIELGLFTDGITLALVTGRSSNDYNSEENLSNYWWEVKTAVSIPTKSFDIYGLLGVGNYFSTSRLFIEYGVGFSRTLGKFSYFAQVSNWDNLWYITPGFAYTF